MKSQSLYSEESRLRTAEGSCMAVVPPTCEGPPHWVISGGHWGRLESALDSAFEAVWWLLCDIVTAPWGPEPGGGLLAFRPWRLELESSRPLTAFLRQGHPSSHETTAWSLPGACNPSRSFLPEGPAWWLHAAGDRGLQRESKWMCLPLASELPHGVTRETRGLTQTSLQQWGCGPVLVPRG